MSARSSRPRLPTCFEAFLRLGVVVALSCSGLPTASLTDPVSVSEVPAVVGVPDRGLDPAVVALTNAQGGTCSGVLLASNVLLTARRCVAAVPDLDACDSNGLFVASTADPSTLHVYTGVPADSAIWASSGVAVLTSNDFTTCGADIALVVLEWPIDGIVPARVRQAGVPQGEYVRTVGLGALSDDAVVVSELLREHLPVLDVSATEFAVGEATCVAAPGTVAYDETTGEVVGVLSRWGVLCGAPNPYDVYTRTDSFQGLIQEALQWAPGLVDGDVEGGVRSRDAGGARDAGRAKKPVTDIGAACLAATDCGTGLCVTVEGSQYCSRACAPDDPCPTDFKCVVASGGASVCVTS